MSRYSFVASSTLKGFFSFSVTSNPFFSAAARTLFQMSLKASAGFAFIFAGSMRNLYSRPPASSSTGARYFWMVWT